MKLDDLLKLYASAYAIDACIESCRTAMFLELDNFDIYCSLKKEIAEKTNLQRCLLRQEIRNKFPKSVKQAIHAGLFDAEAFFALLGQYPELIKDNSESLNVLLGDMERQANNDLNDGDFYLALDDIVVWKNKNLAV